MRVTAVMAIDARAKLAQTRWDSAGLAQQDAAVDVHPKLDVSLGQDHSRMWTSKTG